MYTHTHTCTHTLTHIHTHIHTHMHTYTCMHACTHTHTHMHTHTHTTHTHTHTFDHENKQYCTWENHELQIILVSWGCKEKITHFWKSYEGSLFLAWKLMSRDSLLLHYHSSCFIDLGYQCRQPWQTSVDNYRQQLSAIILFDLHKTCTFKRCVCVCVCMHAYVCGCMPACMCVCVCICMCDECCQIH